MPSFGAYVGGTRGANRAASRRQLLVFFRCHELGFVTYFDREFIREFRYLVGFPGWDKAYLKISACTDQHSTEERENPPMPRARFETAIQVLKRSAGTAPYEKFCI